VGELEELLQPDAGVPEDLDDRPGEKGVLLGSTEVALLPGLGLDRADNSGSTKSGRGGAPWRDEEALTPSLEELPRFGRGCDREDLGRAATLAFRRRDECGEDGASSRMRSCMRARARRCCLFCPSRSRPVIGFGAAKGAHRPGSSSAQWAMSA
jgi:hypothetical protein